MQKHYEPQERDLITKINNVLEREQSVGKEKLSAEKQLSSERGELHENENKLKSAEKHLRDAKERSENAGTAKGVSAGIAFGAAVCTVLTLGSGGLAIIPLLVGAGAAGGAIAFNQIEKNAGKDIVEFRDRIAKSNQTIRKIEDAIFPLSARISQLNSEKLMYQSQRRDLQGEKGKINDFFVFLQNAKTHFSKCSHAAENAVQRTTMMTKVVDKGYTLFNASGTKRVLASFEEAWDAFEEMIANGNIYNFVMVFECTRCGKSYHQFPHVHNCKFICASCHHYISRGGRRCACMLSIMFMTLVLVIYILYVHI